MPHTSEGTPSLRRDGAQVRPYQHGQLTQDAGEQASHDLQDQLLRYQELFSFAPVAYLVTDVQGVILDANYAAAQLLHARREFLLDKPIAFLVTEDHSLAFFSWLRTLEHSEGAREWETTLRTRSGALRDVLVTASAIVPRPGQVTGIRWLMQDITYSKRMERDLLETTTLSERLLQTVEAAVLVLDEAGHIQRANPHVERLIGQRADQLKAMYWCNVFVDEGDRGEVRNLVIEALEKGRAKTRVVGFAGRGGHRSFVWHASPLDLGEPHPLIVVTGHDVTDLLEAQKRALQSERLAAVGQMVTTLTHETRNALQRSRGCLDILQQTLRDRPNSLALVERVRKAQEDIKHLLEDVREFAAPIQLQPGHCSLCEIWREAWMDVASANRHRNLELREETAGLDLDCVCSSFHLRQVFRNLLENSINATPDPVRIVIQCTAARHEGMDAIRTSVMDNGPGFPGENKDLVFEAFFTTKQQGTGLGLAICLRIIEAHGGTIELGSPTAGGEVIVTLPKQGPSRSEA